MVRRGSTVRVRQRAFAAPVMVDRRPRRIAHDDVGGLSDDAGRRSAGAARSPLRRHLTALSLGGACRRQARPWSAARLSPARRRGRGPAARDYPGGREGRMLVAGSARQDGGSRRRGWWNRTARRTAADTKTGTRPPSAGCLGASRRCRQARGASSWPTRSLRPGRARAEALPLTASHHARVRWTSRPAGGTPTRERTRTTSGHHRSVSNADSS